MTILEADHNLDKFQFRFQRLNVKAVADEAFEDAVKEDFIPMLISIIKGKGLEGRGVDEGIGPPLASRRAWKVVREANMRYRIETDPRVGPRALYLEFGTGPIVTATSDKPLKFRTSVPTYDAEPGEIIYRYSVRGVREYRFFREAIERFNRTVGDMVEERIGDEMTDHIKEQLKVG